MIKVWIMGNAFLILLISGCITDPQSSSGIWGMGLPEETELLPDYWNLSTDEEIILDDFIQNLKLLIDCDDKEWDPQINLSRPQSSLANVKGCRPDPQSSGPISEEEFFVLVRESKARYPVLIDLLQDMHPPKHLSLMTFLGHFTTNAIGLGGPVSSPEFAVKGTEGGWIASAESTYERYNSTGDPAMLRAAQSGILRTHHSIEMALLFIQAWDDVVPTCTYDYTLARERLEQSVDALRATNAAWIYSTVEFIFHHEINMSYDAYHQLVQRALAFETLDSDVLPTYYEAIYLLNRVLEDPERPGMRERMELFISLLGYGPEGWGERGARNALAFYEMDWSPLFHECQR